MNYRLLYTGCLLLFAFTVHAKSKNYLKSCWQKQVHTLRQRCLVVAYKETLNKLYTGMEPWAHTTTHSEGGVCMGADNYLKIDSSKRGKKIYTATTQLTLTELLYQNYGDTALTPVTKSEFLDEVTETARYAPVFLINYFHSHHPEVLGVKDGYCEYRLTINKTVVKLYIQTTDNLLHKITLLDNHDFYGDVVSTYYYEDYDNAKKLFFPRSVFIDKVNGKVKDTVSITSANIVGTVQPVLKKPGNYKWKEEKEKKPDIEIVKYNDHIHFIALKHINTNTMVVEFSNFLAVVAAPVSSQVGEILITEARKLAPSKPIKYFSYGHRCPWVMAGLRPFVHDGVTILQNTPADKDFLDYLVNAPHTLVPDSLQLEPRPLKTESIHDSLTITDGSYTMKIYVIGETSKHTNDYMLYYFPAEKLLWEDDLAWINKDKVSGPPYYRQAGLYEGIEKLKLDVADIAQSWGSGTPSVKTVFTYKELKESLNSK